MAEESLDTKPAQTSPPAGTQQQATSPQRPAAQSERDKEKVRIAKDANYQIGEFLNDKLALIDERVDEQTNFGMKIVTYFIPKFNKGKDFYDANNAINLTYSSMIKEIVLEDALDSIGLRGHIDVYNEGGVIEGVVERHNLFYLVLNITEYMGDQSIKYEPYIFEIDSVNQVTSAFRSGSRVIRFHVVDVITSILRSHSIASFIKFSGLSVTSSKNYKILFRKIIDYVKNFIKINTDNTFEFKKDVFFDENTMFKGRECLNGYDADLDVNALVTFSFNKVDKNASIWEALQVFLTDCVTSIKLSDAMKASFETIGDVLIPFFFKEEYADCHGLYNTLWQPGQKPEDTKPSSGGTTTPATQPVQTTTPTQQTGETTNTRTVTPRDAAPSTNDQSLGDKPATTDAACAATESVVAQDTVGTNAKKNDETVRQNLSSIQELVNRTYGGKSNALVYRPITMRDFFMPFHLCFTYEPSIVFQDINESNTKIMSIEPKINDQLQSLKFTTIDKTTVDKRWKNVVFLDTQHSSANSTIIFFDWFYRFFLKMFLNSSKMGGKQNYISNVIPDFYLFSLLHGVGGANDSNTETFNNLFDEYNSYTVATETKDTTHEALREMGKNLASLVLLNDSYSFSLKGNIRRRPNEIMRLNVGELAQGGELQLPIFTNLNQDSSLYVYVRKVTHIFQGNEYINKIVASKICEGY